MKFPLAKNYDLHVQMRYTSLTCSEREMSNFSAWYVAIA
jgi:hypothetical protein